jgi:hypothetical protein
MALGKGAYAIHQSGKWYTNDNIDRMLMERHLNKKARRSSGKNHIKGPKKRTPEDDEHFSESFERMIRMAIQNREGENNERLDYYTMEAEDDQFDTEEVIRLLKRLDELEPQPLSLPEKSVEKILEDFWKYIEERECEERIISEM